MNSMKSTTANLLYLERIRDELKSGGRVVPEELERLSRCYREARDELLAKAAATGTASIIGLLLLVYTWLVDKPLWVQILALVIGLAILAGVAYYLYKSKDRIGDLIKILQYINEIWEIIKQLEARQPVASFTAEPSSGPAPLKVMFTYNGSNAVTWTWSFGDGATSNETNPCHVYYTPGCYTVTLRVDNVVGSDSKTMTITVSGKPTPPGPVSKTPPGVEFVPVGSEMVARIGGEHQADMDEWLRGGDGWPGGTVKVMDSTDPSLDVLPNYLWAFWYDGALAPKGWMISQQGYYYLDNPATAKNCLHSIVAEPWVQPGTPRGIPLSEVLKIERMGDTWVLTVSHDGEVKRVVWSGQEMMVWG